MTLYIFVISSTYIRNRMHNLREHAVGMLQEVIAVARAIRYRSLMVYLLWFQ